MNNVGKTDKIVRLIIGLGLISLLFTLEGNLKFIGLIGIVPILTAFLSYCPLYSIFGFRTCSITEENRKKNKS